MRDRMRPRSLRTLCLALASVPLLGACINDGATYEIDGTREHVLSLLREQTYFWDKRVNLSLVVSRMPTCMRRHSIGPAFPNSKVEIYQVPSGAFIVKAGKRMFVTETQTCENFAKLNEEPPEGMGTLKGIFQEKNGELIFEPAKDSETPKD